jgi:hypothetical protein
VLAAVRAVNRLEFLAQTLRAALEALSAATPDWLATHIDAQWVPRYGARADSDRFPQGEDKPTKLAVQVGADGCDLLEAIHTDHAPAWLREVPAVVVPGDCVDHAVPPHDHRRQGWRWRGGRTKTSRPAENGSVHPMTPTLDTRPSAAAAGKATRSTSAKPATMRPLPASPHLITNVATTDATVTDAPDAGARPHRPRPPQPAS